MREIDGRRGTDVRNYVSCKEETMPRPRILVINPNSNVVVTKGLEAALQPLDFADGPEIVCATLAERPYGVESPAGVDSVTMPLRRLGAGDNGSASMPIACYSRSRLEAIPACTGAQA